MKRFFVLTLLLFVTLSLAAGIGFASYKGKIGPYGVEFEFSSISGEGRAAHYRYTTIKVNHGDWITLEEAGWKGDYQIFKEYINGRHTGTFTIIFNDYGLKGTFVNSKGKRYKVNAKRVSSYYEGF